MRLSASFNPSTGQYGFKASGLELRGVSGLTNFTGEYFVNNQLLLTIGGASLITSQAFNDLYLPFAGLQNRKTRTAFNFSTLPSVYGSINAFNTTATQQGSNFVVSTSAVMSIPNVPNTNNYASTVIFTNGTMTITIGNRAINLLPTKVLTNNLFLARYANTNILTRLSVTHNSAFGVIPIAPASNAPPYYYETPLTVTFQTAAIPDTGIPPATNGAVTIYDLPISFAIPTGQQTYDQFLQLVDLTNIFTTTVELKRPTSTSTKWSQ
jgi:hypothetical protein